MSDQNNSDHSSKSIADEERIAGELAGIDRHTDPFVAAVHATRMPMIITNPRLTDNPVVFANDSFCRLTGYNREEIVGRNCRFLQGEDTDPATVKKLHDAVEQVLPVEVDIRNYRKDGEPFWNRLLMAPVFNADHKLAYFFASQVDVTIERERLTGLEQHNVALMAEITSRLRAQQERERELALALRAGGFGTWSFELATQALTASDECKALFGRAPDEPFSYEDRIAAIHPDDRQRSLEGMAKAGAREREYHEDYRVCWPDNSMHWLSSRGQPFFDADGKAVRIAGVSMDITTAKRAEMKRQALIRLNDVFRNLDDSTDISYVAAEILGQTLGVSRAGYGVVDPVRETITIARDWNAPGISTIAGTLQFRDHGSYIEDLKRGDTATVEDSRLDPRTADTSAVLEAISARSFINMPLTEQGEFVALIFVNNAEPRHWSDDDIDFVREIAERTRDASERRRAERGLADLAASLERQVLERTAELVAAEEALRQSQKMEAVGQLTGGVAHDFNNLLTVITGSVDLLRRPGLTDEKRDRYINAIGDTADRAAKLTAQLLAFARRQTLIPETFDCGGSVAEVASMVRTLTGSRIILEAIVPEDPCYVLADRGQFDTAIVNLSINARDAMDGEGRLTIAVGPVSGIPEIRSHPPVAGDFVAITIADTGSGISSENMDRIFEPFFTTKGLGEGTGLGLSQVFGFAKQSGGDIQVESQDGEGTTFTLYLPRVAADGSQADREETQPLAIAGEGVCILVVEDNSSVGEFVVQALTELGYNTVLAVDGQEALAKLDKDSGRFHVVFSDVVMPGMSGLELAQEIRTRHPRLPVILTSGYSHVLAQNGRHGFELLHKPYSIEQLSRVFRKAITWRAESDG